jgi:hypothetical protein
MRTRPYLLASILFSSLAIAAPAHAAPAMFEASFIFHAWSNDVSSGYSSPYDSNYWTAVPLGYDCAHAEKYSGNALNPRYCSPAKMAKGHPATGTWSRSVGTGTPPRITLQQSDLGVHLYTHPVGWPTQTDTDTPHCCRGFLITFPPYLQTITYATFVNAAGSFFAGGGAAVAGYFANGTGTTAYNNLTGMNGTGTWHIKASVNAFGGAMGMLGKYGAWSKWSIAGVPTFYEGTWSWAMIPDIGRKMYNTLVGQTAMGARLYQNPIIKTGKFYMYYTNEPTTPGKTSTLTAVGLGTLWTTGQVNLRALAGQYATSLWRTGYDNRDASGFGRIQLVTPTITHWYSTGLNDYAAQIGLLTIQVPEPRVTLLLVAGAGALLWLRHVSRRY